MDSTQLVQGGTLTARIGPPWASNFIVGRVAERLKVSEAGQGCRGEPAHDREQLAQRLMLPRRCSGLASRPSSSSETDQLLGEIPLQVGLQGGKRTDRPTRVCPPAKRSRLTMIRPQSFLGYEADDSRSAGLPRV